MERLIYRFDELGQTDSEIAGKKCANLGELTQAGFRVPPGFAVALDAYSRFMTETGVRARIDEWLTVFAADPNITADMSKYEQASVAIRGMVEETEMPAGIEAAIREHYHALCRTTGIDAVPVATRSAGPASHPGQYESYLLIAGAAEVVGYVRKVWSSTFNTRSLIARARAGLPLSYDPIGVAVLQMVDAKAAGVMFTTNPSDGDTSKIFIEANWGLGESVVAGEVTPDSFLVEKVSSEIVKRSICLKKTWFALDPTTGKPSFQEVPEDKKNAATLTDAEVQEIARVGVRIEGHFGGAQDIEWAVDANSCLPESVILLQTRPAKHVAEKKNPTDRIIDFMLRGL